MSRILKREVKRNRRRGGNPVLPGGGGGTNLSKSSPAIISTETDKLLQVNFIIIIIISTLNGLFLREKAGNALALNRRNSLPCTVSSFRQRSYNQSVDCLLCSMARIYDLLEGSLDQSMVCRSLC